MSSRLDEIRGSTLDKIASSERNWKILIVLTAIVEAAGLVALVLLMDFGDRLHLLLLIASLLVYWTLAAWTWALHVHGSANAHRILKSLDILHDEIAKRE